MTESKPQSGISPYLAIGFAVLAISTASIFIRFAQREAPSLVIAAYRLSLAVLILLPLVVRKHLDELQSLGKKAFLLALLSGFFLAVHFAVWITSLEYTTVASSVVLVTTTPLWVAMMAPLAIGERITKPILVGMVITLLGGLIVGLGDTCTMYFWGLHCPPFSAFVSGRAFIGDALALTGALAAAAYLMIGRSLRGALSLVPYVFLVYGMAAVILVLAALASGAAMFGYSGQTYLWFLLLAVFPQLLGHSIYNWALKYLSASYVSITLLGEPSGTILLAYIFLREIPSGVKLFGAILILMGILLAARRDVALVEPAG